MGVQHPAGKVIRRHMTEPANEAPYFPDWHDKTGEGCIYSHGQFKEVWSPTATGYSPDGQVVTVDSADGSWEMFDVGPPYRLIGRGTWSYVT